MLGKVLLVVPVLVACGETDDDVADVTTRDQMGVAHRFDVTPAGPSSFVLDVDVTIAGETHAEQIVLPVIGGELVAEAPASQLAVHTASVELGSLSLGRAFAEEVVVLRDLRVVLAAPVACDADWAADGEAASCVATARLRLELGIGIGEATVTLPPLSFGSVDLGAALDHVGPELRLDLAGEVGGVAWAVPELDLQATGTLTFDLAGAALADSWRR